MINLVKPFNNCRRTFIAFISIVGLFIFGYLRQIDISSTVASVAIALAAGNAAENVFISKSAGSDARKSKKEEESE